MNKLDMRKDKFDGIVHHINEKGYVMKFQPLSMKKINIIAFILLLGYGALLILIDILFYGSLNINFSFQKYWIFLAIVIACLVVHEGIHALTAMIVGKVPFRDIEFGMIKGNPYCYVCAQLSKQHYFLFSLMPTIFLGIILGIIGLILHDFWIILLASFNFSSGAGDLCVSYQLWKQDCEFVMDHPSKIGFVYFEKAK